jgi:hypothetical protein
MDKIYPVSRSLIGSLCQQWTITCILEAVLLLLVSAGSDCVPIPSVCPAGTRWLTTQNTSNCRCIDDWAQMDLVLKVYLLSGSADDEETGYLLSIMPDFETLMKGCIDCFAPYQTVCIFQLVCYRRSLFSDSWNKISSRNILGL